MSPDSMFSSQNGVVFLLCNLLSSLAPLSWAQHRNNKLEEFRCPEEFGYHPHPADCSLYYVCVFGRALLESCSGGLMYSHYLQTCDWPRNVGCGTSTSSSEFINNANSLYTIKGSINHLVSEQTTPSWRHEALRSEQQDHQAPDRHLYAGEDVGPAKEIESDSQQRVYRKQPPTIGQVARDRDGFVRHVNALQTSGLEKMKPVAVYSFSPHHQSFRPSPSAPSYVVEQPANPVPTTSKTIFNFTKFQPHYNFYDVEGDVLRDNDFGQLLSQKKVIDNYEVVQKPEYSSIPHHSPTVNNIVNHSKQQNYRFQSTVDDANQLPEDASNTRLFTDENHWKMLSKTARNEFFTSSPNSYSPLNYSFLNRINGTNRYYSKITAFEENDSSNKINDADEIKEETVSSETLNVIRTHERTPPKEHNFLDNETSQLPVVSSHPHEIAQNFSVIQESELSSPLQKSKPRNQDNFRIIVDPVTVYRKMVNAPIKEIPYKNSPPADKLSAVQYRSQVNTFTYSPYTAITTSKSPFNSSRILKQRRFYIPKIGVLDHKSQTPIRSPNPQSLILTTIKNLSTTPIARPFENENLKSFNNVTENSEIAYYDDYYYDDEGDEVVGEDNYLENRTPESTTIAYKTDNLSKQKLRTKKLPPTAVNTRNQATFTISTPTRYESTTREADENKNLQLAKDSNIQRCSQCNEKPFVRGRHRGSTTYANVKEEYESASSGRKTRPTLKPSTLIVSKSEPVNIYESFPKRPDNVFPTPQMDKVAAKCRRDICLLPDCSCGGKDIPGDLPIEETPQIVLLTFDDSVNELNKGLYGDLFEKSRVNPNGCPISATFYVSHEWTDYSMVQNLYASGHEIASHSVSHSFGEQFSQRKWTKEIVGQREILAAYGGVRQEDIRGMRAPFLAVGGNKMFKMLYDSNFTYDSSMPIYENRPPSWPYTLDYKIFHDCMIPPCPTKSYPGIWETPMVMWQDLNGGRCSMGDACSNPPTADGVQKMLMMNFERHFTTNRAPFGLFYHSSWFTQPHHKEGFINFLDSIMNMPEVWLVTNWQAIQWARDPTPISRLNQFTPFGCDYPERPKRCNNSKVCNLWHKSGVRYLKTCQPCPDVYPWTGKTGVRSSKVDNDDIPIE